MPAPLPAGGAGGGRPGSPRRLPPTPALGLPAPLRQARGSAAAAGAAPRSPVGSPVPATARGCRGKVASSPPQETSCGREESCFGFKFYYFLSYIVRLGEGGRHRPASPPRRRAAPGAARSPRVPPRREGDPRPGITPLPPPVCRRRGLRALGFAACRFFGGDGDTAAGPGGTAVAVGQLRAGSPELAGAAAAGCGPSLPAAGGALLGPAVPRVLGGAEGLLGGAPGGARASAESRAAGGGGIRGHKHPSSKLSSA